MPRVGDMTNRSYRNSFLCHEIDKHGYEQHCPICSDSGYEYVKIKKRQTEKHSKSCANGCAHCDEIIDAASPCRACHAGQTIRRGRKLEQRERANAIKRREKIIEPHEYAQQDPEVEFTFDDATQHTKQIADGLLFK